ncbi:tail fibers protein [Escherichia phage vB_EcoS_PNS1]|uniref:Tail fibers protein n=1 Tax=Escherichia phage vB_EcoS_PNS1 TaxID=2488596 RepID=A0A3G8F5K0_9CAUD|nr:tail fibers protein [Escherichia phage vB_EcoS_PNS1]AZF89792.1 tail fibers protein [Escherichia phage vB_EcoS_PNS1]
MAAGTLSVTNNSKAVVGVGTAFTSFTAGDFLTLVVGQVPYTVAIASVESDTALTLVLPFDGPTATGLAWDGIKRDTMSLATMGVTVQAQKALRLMMADENNWRAIFGDAEEITVTLPSGQVMQGMSWGYLSSLLKDVDPVEMRNLQQQATASEAAAQGFRDQAEEWAKSVNADNLLTKSGNLAGLADQSAARVNLGLDRLEQSTYDTRLFDASGGYYFFIADSDWGCVHNTAPDYPRIALPVASGGTGGTTEYSACQNLRALNCAYDINTNYGSEQLYTGIGFYGRDVSPQPGGDGGPFGWAEIMTIAEGGGGPGSVGNWSQIGFSTAASQAPRYRQRIANPGQVTNWRDFLIRDLNTTVDSNGFIKIASPIVKIKGDGTAEFNDESEGCSVTRVSKGVYVISGCLGLNSDASWGGVNGGFEIPVDVNKQPLLWLDYEVLDEGSIEIRTYHRTHTNAPKFARNIIDGIEDGDPIDIPPSTYISVRVQMPTTGLETATSSA